MYKAIALEFPLRGEWLSPTTPAKRIPSHGTNKFGLRYAFDFLQVDWNRKGRPFYNTSVIKYLTLGVKLKVCYCWGENVYAPCDGEVVKIVDGIVERNTVFWLSDSFRALRNSLFFDHNKDGFSTLAGNYVIIKHSDNVYVALAHLQNGSIAVSLNEKIKKGTLLGRVGHSGNSMMPHLHFQVMDRLDVANAIGLSCVFEEYEAFRNNKWQVVYNSIPSDTERFRFLK